MQHQAEKWYLTRQTFPELLHRNIGRFPERKAQIWRDGRGAAASLSYGDLGIVVRELAEGLLSLGVERGDRVAIIAPTVPQWLWADYAILCCGAISVSIHPSLSAYEITEQIRDSGSRFAFVYGESVLERVLTAGSYLKALIWMEDRDMVQRHAGFFTLEAFREAGRTFHRSTPLLYGERWRGVQPEDPMTLIYTSGTTGQAKGVLHTHASMTAACIRDLYMLPLLSETDCLLAYLPLAHSFERQGGHGTAMFAALPIAYGSAKNLGEDLRFFQPTYMMGVPSIYLRLYARVRGTLKGSLQRFLFHRAEQVGLAVIEASLNTEKTVNMAEKGRPWLRASGWIRKGLYLCLDWLVFRKLRQRLGGRLRFVFSAASALPEKICRLYLCAGIRILEGYGATETCNAVTLTPLEAVKPGSAGLFSRGVAHRIAVDGELLVKGDFLFREYWGRPEDTRNVFTDDGYYQTGDVVELLEDGYLRVVDRKKGLLMLSTGHRVAPSKIETLFALSPYIERVLVLGDDRPFPLVLVQPNFRAFVRMFKKHGIPFDEDAVKEGPEGNLLVYPEFVKIPELVTLVEIEVATVNGKLQNFEKIGNYIILNVPLSMERGEVTPTLKIRRDVVISHYRTFIDRAYAKGLRF